MPSPTSPPDPVPGIPRLTDVQRIALPDVSGQASAFGAWLALAAPPRAPGLLLVPQGLGRDEDVAAQCQYWARQGFHTLGPDLLWRQAPAQRGTPAHAVDIDQGVNDLQLAANWMIHLDGSPRPVGCVGHGLGGLLSFRTAVYGPLHAAVAYAPRGIERHLDEIPSLDCPVMIHLDESDAQLLPPLSSRLARALAERPGSICHRYPVHEAGPSNPLVAGSHHATASDLDEAAHAETLAHRRTAAFLRLHLDEGPP